MELFSRWFLFCSVFSCVVFSCACCWPSVLQLVFAFSLSRRGIWHTSHGGVVFINLFLCCFDANSSWFLCPFVGFWWLLRFLFFLRSSCSRKQQHVIINSKGVNGHLREPYAREASQLPYILYSSPFTTPLLPVPFFVVFRLAAALAARVSERGLYWYSVQRARNCQEGELNTTEREMKGWITEGERSSCCF